MRFSFPSRFYFFTGWFAALLGIWLCIAAIYSVQYTDLLGNYIIYAWAAMVAPFLVIAMADKLTIQLYEGCWRSINNRFLGPLLLEMDTIRQLRESVREQFWLRLFAPREPRTVKQQMQLIAQWWPALMHREAGFRERFAELLLDNLVFYAGLPLALLVYLSADRQLNHALGLGLAGGTLLILGLALLRLAARLQAVKDFFEAWRTRLKTNTEEY